MRHGDAVEMRPAGLGKPFFLAMLFLMVAAGCQRDEDGVVTQKSRDGSRRAEATFKEGKIDGPVSFYHPGGKVLRYEGAFQAGEPVGHASPPG